MIGLPTLRNRVTLAVSAGIGVLMLVVWIGLLAGRRVPELIAAPVETLGHLVIELLTAFALLVGAYGLSRRRPWGVPLHLVSLGMLLYALVSAGSSYAQLRVWPAVILFALLLIVTIALIIRGIRTS